jgi:hypothetical protein
MLATRRNVSNVSEREIVDHIGSVVADVGDGSVAELAVETAPEAAQCSSRGLSTNVCRSGLELNDRSS